VDPVPDPLLFRKSGSAGNRTWTSGFVARNFDHQTTEAVNDNDNNNNNNNNKKRAFDFSYSVIFHRVFDFTAAKRLWK
jgi:hypothetical protein